MKRKIPRFLSLLLSALLLCSCGTVTPTQEKAPAQETPSEPAASQPLVPSEPQPAAQPEPTAVIRSFKRVTYPLKPEYTILFFGDATVGQLPSILSLFGDEIGTTINVINGTYNNADKELEYKTSSFNLYELYKFSSTNYDTASIQSESTGNTATAIFNALREGNIDFFVAETSRDRAYLGKSGAAGNLKAFEKIAADYFGNGSSNGKVVLLAPPAYRDNALMFPMIYSDNDLTFTQRSGISDFSQHTAAIKAYSDSIKAALPLPEEKILSSYMCDAFAFFVKNYPDADFSLWKDSGVTLTPEGCYYEACLLFHQLFGVSTVGMSAAAGISSERAALLQEAAEKYFETPDDISVPPAEKTALNVLLCGDGVFTANDFPSVLSSLGREDGITLNVICGAYDTANKERENKASTYNLYELYTFSDASGVKTSDYGNGAITAKATGNTAKRVFDALSAGNIDFFVMDTGRDRNLLKSGSFAAGSLKAVRQLVTDYYYPGFGNGSVVFFAPPAYPDGSVGFSLSYGSDTFAKASGASTAKDHTALIKAFLQKAADDAGLSERTQYSFMCDAFSYCAGKNPSVPLFTDTKLTLSDAGTYFEACVLYSQLTGKPTAGNTFTAKLDAATAKKLQTAADNYVFGK